MIYAASMNMLPLNMFFINGGNVEFNIKLQLRNYTVSSPEKRVQMLTAAFQVSSLLHLAYPEGFS